MDLPAKRPGMPAVLAGATAPVDRKTYAIAGFGLMLVKYLGEAGLVFATTGALFNPLVFLSPSVSLRLDVLNTAPDWAVPAMALWTLPFIWIGASMTVRRARDAGLSSLFGLFFFFPLLNFLVMLGLCALPSRPRPEPAELAPLSGEDRGVWAALSGVAAGSSLALGMVLLSVFGFGEYGGALFVGTPFVMGMVSAFLFNLRTPHGWLANIGVGVATVGVSGGLLMLFALEGAICLAMAAPLAVALALMGVALGKVLASLEGRRAVALPVVGLPFLPLVEAPPGGGAVHEVVSAVDIAAPPEVVWDNVIGFGGVELPPPAEWFFNLGIAYPIRARIEGEGPGAVRYCEFSTGPFVEPITTWDAPRHLAFDVVESPPTMHEWSPWRHVFAPHLETVLKSRRGEFRLTPLPDGGTRLEGHTWYTFEMAPSAYWALWSDASIHAIHLRVLEHIARVSEASSG
ncbi:MAG: SRPBCC family protein [Alphaproteobacteria bacterium]|nr:SRPBCC family protein [Alphaproteobacteria bacterium]